MKINEAMNLFPERLIWDKGMLSGSIISKFSTGYLGKELEGKTPFHPVGFGGGEIITTEYSTAPAVGGSISSRNFFDVRWCSPVNEKDGSRMFVSFTVDNLDKMTLEEKNKIGYFTPTKGIIRAKNIEGCQILKALPPTSNGTPRTEITTISVSEINGWLPPSLINSATGDSLVAMIKGITAYVENKEEGGGNKEGGKI